MNPSFARSLFANFAENYTASNFRPFSPKPPTIGSTGRRVCRAYLDGERRLDGGGRGRRDGRLDARQRHAAEAVRARRAVHALLAAARAHRRLDARRQPARLSAHQLKDGVVAVEHHRLGEALQESGGACGQAGGCAQRQDNRRL